MRREPLQVLLRLVLEQEQAQWLQARWSKDMVHHC